MGLSIVICEDNPIHRKILKKHLIDILNRKNIEYKMFEFESGEKLIEGYPGKADIVFLDIQMNELTGMDTAREIRRIDMKCDIVFTTALDRYMQEGYEVRACRYLLKPIKYEDIWDFINSISKKNPKYIIVNQVGNEGNVKIDIDDVYYIETINRCSNIYTKGGCYTTRVKLESFEKELECNNFYRCHRCYIINLTKARITKANSVLIDKIEIPISRRKIKDFRIKLTDILGEILC